MSPEEFAALSEVIGEAADADGDREEPNPYPIAALKLLIFTGARRNEVLMLRWDEVDFERGVVFHAGIGMDPKRYSFGDSKNVYGYGQIRAIGSQLIASKITQSSWQVTE